jgi:hypothetical protein
MAAALVRAGRGHRSARSGIAADQAIGQGSLDQSDDLASPLYRLLTGAIDSPLVPAPTKIRVRL